jgi:outer membrane cobalamin receptor
MEANEAATAHATGATTPATGALSPVEPALITITAARTVPLDLTGGAELGSRALDRLASPTILDALDQLTGVRAFQKGGAGGSSFLSVRGGEPNFTLVLLEGVRLNDPTNSAGGAFDFAQLDPALLDGVEVARGALSAMHGADALSGVVNLRLARPRAAGWTVHGRALGSSAGEAGLAAGALLGAGDAGGLLLAGSGWRSGALTAGSRLSRAQGLARGEVRAGSLRLEALLVAGATGRTGFPEDGGGPRLSLDSDLAHRDTWLTLGALGARLGDPDRVEAGLRLAGSRQIDDAVAPAIAPGPGAPAGVPAIKSRSRFARIELGADATGRLGDDLRWATGISLLSEVGKAQGSVDLGLPVPASFRLTRRRAGAFAELTASAGAITATIGGRVDAGDGDRIRTTGRSVLRASLGKGWAMRAALAQGFKLPSLYALAYPLIANPDLRPERGRSAELALEGPLPGGRASVTLSRTDYRDLVDFDPERFTNVNRARVRVQGVEAELSIRPVAGLRVEAGATFSETENRDGPPLRGRPRWSASALAEWSPRQRLTVWLQARHVGRFHDFSVPTGVVMAHPRMTLDIGSRLEASSGLALEARLMNATGAAYEEAVGFPAPGRRLAITLSARY